MNIDNFTIESSDIEFAQGICNLIADSDIRNRAVANVVAGNIAKKFFDIEKYDVDNESGLHNIGYVLEDIDISDIYINGNYIDVRIFFDEDEIVVPISHFTNNLLPVAYMFIKLEPDLAGATVLGFIEPEDIDKTAMSEGYYKIKSEDLKSFYDIEQNLITIEDSYDVNDKVIFNYIDNNIDDRNNFYSSIIKSKTARLTLGKAVKAKEIFQFVSINVPVKEETVAINEDDFSDDTLFIQDTNDTLLEEIIDTDNSIDDLSSNINTSLDIEMDLDALNEEDSENNEITSDEDIIVDLAQEGSEDFEISQINSSIDDMQEIELDFQSNVIENAYSTITTPSLNTLTAEAEAEAEAEEQEQEQEATLDNINSVNPELDNELESFTEVEIDTVEESTNDSIIDTPVDNDNEDTIETLFEDNTNINTESMENDEQEFSSGNTNLKENNISKPLVTILLLAIIAGAGYFGYTKFSQPNSIENQNNAENDIIATSEQQTETTEEAMPIENVNTNEIPLIENEGISESIPVIEQNLDASILVSNLKVDWEVPSAYTSNTSAKRYLIKLGKIIQLNLKTELLLLNKPPITNKIAVELKYNNDSRKFEAIGVTISSGEKSVDNVILETVNKALAMNISVNTDSFSKLQGNPVLIIHL